MNWRTRPFWRQKRGQPGLRHRIPIRRLIRTGAERLAAEAAARRLEEQLSSELATLAGLGVPEIVLERTALLHRDALALVEGQLVEHARLSAGVFDARWTLSELGLGLVRLRLAVGISQRELASRLGVSASTICRNEGSAYRGISLEKALRVLVALGAEATVTIGVVQPRP